MCGMKEGQQETRRLRAGVPMDPRREAAAGQTALRGSSRSDRYLQPAGEGFLPGGCQSSLMTDDVCCRNSERLAQGGRIYISPDHKGSDEVVPPRARLHLMSGKDALREGIILRAVIYHSASSELASSELASTENARVLCRSPPSSEFCYILDLRDESETPQQHLVRLRFHSLSAEPSSSSKTSKLSTLPALSTSSPPKSPRPARLTRSPTNGACPRRSRRIWSRFRCLTSCSTWMIPVSSRRQHCFSMDLG